MVELFEQLERLPCRRQHRQRACEDVRVRAAALAREHRHCADGLEHQVDDAKHLVRRRRVVGDLGKVRRRGLGRQVAHLLAREVGHRQVDVAEVAVLAELADQRVLDDTAPESGEIVFQHDASQESETFDFWFITVQIRLNDAGEIAYMEYVYVPWA